MRVILPITALLIGLSLPLQLSKGEGSPPSKPAPTPAYAFRINDAGLILDNSGMAVAPADIPDHFTKLGIKPGTVLMLLVPGPDAIKAMTATVRAFGPGYTKILVKNYQATDKAGWFDLPVPRRRPTPPSNATGGTGNSIPAAAGRGASAGANAAQAALGDWMTHFYQTQDVKSFAGFWDEVIEDHMLENRNQIEPMVGFLGPFFHQHPDFIKGRIDDPDSFAEAQRDSVLRILWLSDTKEARTILGKSGHLDLSQKPIPEVGGWKINRGQDLDFCWGWYSATGELDALNPIISTLDLGKYAGALKKYPTSQKTDQDKRAAMNDAIFGAAMWSLMSNGKDDARISQHLGEALHDPETPKPRRMWLTVILAKIAPDRIK